MRTGLAHAPPRSHVGEFCDVTGLGRTSSTSAAIERDDPDQLRGVLPKVYGRSELEPTKLGELVNDNHRRIRIL